jgi:hypothetical protein
MLIECPNCKFSGNAPDDKIPEAGTTATCPKCTARFTVEKPILPTATHATDDTKPCRFCGEEILAIAVNCKRCGKTLEEAREEPPTIRKKNLSVQPVEVKSEKTEPPKRDVTLPDVIAGIALALFIIVPLFSYISDAIEPSQNIQARVAPPAIENGS